MKNADKKITLFNSHLDPVTGYTHYIPTYFDGVSVFSQTKVNVDKDGLSAADLHTIRIPDGATSGLYVSPVDYKQNENKQGLFTLSLGDVIVLGVADDEDPRPGDLEKKYGRDQVVTIIGITDNHRGPEPHWKVICK